MPEGVDHSLEGVARIQAGAVHSHTAVPRRVPEVRRIQVAVVDCSQDRTEEGSDYHMPHSMDHAAVDPDPLVEGAQNFEQEEEDSPLEEGSS